MADYIPNSDPAFLTWATNLSSYLTTNEGALPIGHAETAEVSNELGTFNINFNRHTAAQDAAKAACNIKDKSRGTIEDTIRTVVRQLQASPDVTDQQRAAMGIPVHASGRVMAFATPIGQPVGVVDTSKRLRHVIRYWDSQSSGKARPAYATGCEIWCAITAAGEPAPGDEEAYRNLGTNSASPFAIEYAMTDGGKKAHYILRWTSRDGAKGPWSETISATIVG